MNLFNKIFALPMSVLVCSLCIYSTGLRAETAADDASPEKTLFKKLTEQGAPADKVRRALQEYIELSVPIITGSSTKKFDNDFNQEVKKIDEKYNLTKFGISDFIDQRVQQKTQEAAANGGKMVDGSHSGSGATEDIREKAIKDSTNQIVNLANSPKFEKLFMNEKAENKTGGEDKKDEDKKDDEAKKLAEKKEAEEAKKKAELESTLQKAKAFDEGRAQQIAQQQQQQQQARNQGLGAGGSGGAASDSSGSSRGSRSRDSSPSRSGRDSDSTRSVLSNLLDHLKDNQRGFTSPGQSLDTSKKEEDKKDGISSILSESSADDDSDGSNSLKSGLAKDPFKTAKENEAAIEPEPQEVPEKQPPYQYTLSTEAPGLKPISFGEQFFGSGGGNGGGNGGGKGISGGSSGKAGGTDGDFLDGQGIGAMMASGGGAPGSFSFEKKPNWDQSGGAGGSSDASSDNDEAGAEDVKKEKVDLMALVGRLGSINETPLGLSTEGMGILANRGTLFELACMKHSERNVHAHVCENSKVKGKLKKVSSAVKDREEAI